MPGNDLVQSVVRGLDILTHVGQHADGVSLNDLAAAVDLKTPTVHKLLRSLASRGFVEKTERPVRYRLGPAVLEIANSYWAGEKMARAEAACRELAGRFPQGTITLCRSVGGEVMCLLRLSPERPSVLQRPVGRAMAPYTSASALLFQAFWTEESRSAFRARHPLWEEGGHVWESETALDTHLAGIRECGLSEAPKGLPKASALAAPVFDRRKSLWASLGINLLKDGAENPSDESVAEALRRAAASISDMASD